MPEKTNSLLEDSRKAELEKHRLEAISILDAFLSEENEKLEEQMRVYFRFSTLHDQGTQAAIYKYTVHDLQIAQQVDPRVAEQLSNLSVDLNQLDEQDPLRALKVMKIASRPATKREYQRQMEALAIYEKIDKQELSNYALIPRVNPPVRFTPDRESAARLARHNVQPDIDGKVDVLPMDFVDGEDLYKILCKAIIERWGGLSAEDLYHLNDLVELEDRALIILGEPRTAVGMNENEIYARHLRLQGKLLRRANEAGFRVPQQVIDKVARTLQLWKKEKFVHGDFHLRNLMLTGGYRAIKEGREVEPVIIDFGGEGSAGEDDSMLYMLRLINAEKGVTNAQEQASLRSMIRTLYAGPQKKYWDNLRLKFLEAKENHDMRHRLIVGLVSDVLQEGERGAAFVLDVVDAGLVSAEEVAQEFKNLLEENRLRAKAEAEISKIKGPAKKKYFQAHQKELTEYRRITQFHRISLIQERLLPELGQK